MRPLTSPTQLPVILFDISMCLGDKYLLEVKGIAMLSLHFLAEQWWMMATLLCIR